MPADKSIDQNAELELRLREGFDAPPALNPEFNETVLDAVYAADKTKRLKSSWRSWLMSAWWALTAAMVSYVLADLIDSGANGIGVALVVAAVTLGLCGWLLFGTLRRCGIRLADTLLKTLELG